MPTNTKTLKSDEKSLSDNKSVKKTTDTKSTSATEDKEDKEDDVVAKRNARSAEIESTFSDVLESEEQLQNNRDYGYSN